MSMCISELHWSIRVVVVYWFNSLQQSLQIILFGVILRYSLNFKLFDMTFLWSAGNYLTV